MTESIECLPVLFNSPSLLGIARDFLLQKAGESPGWMGSVSAEAFAALPAASRDAAALSAWCATHLGSGQLRTLRNFLRTAAKQQRMYKHTISLTPRAHLLVKTLAEKEGVTMSDVIERYLADGVHQRYGLSLRTSFNEHTGQLGHDIIRAV